MKKIVISAIMIAINMYAEAQTKDSVSYELNLGEVVVKSHVPKGKVIAGGMSTRISGSVLEKVGSARQVLEHLSGIKKKMDGSFELIGKGTSIIYVNGRQLHDMSELDHIKSDELQKVDVLTSPGAEYNANDNSVICIKTIKNKDNGWTSDVSSQVGYSYKTDMSRQVTESYKHDNLEVIGIFRNEIKHKRETATTNINTHVDSLWQQHATSVDYGKERSLYGQIAINYSIGKNHTIGAMYEVTGISDGKTTNHNLTDVLVNEQKYDYWDTQESILPHIHPTQRINVYYNGKIRNWDINFNGDMMTNGSRQSDDISELSQNYTDYNATTLEHTTNHLYAAKFTAAHPLWKGMISTGSELTFTNRHTDFSGYKGIIGSSDDDIHDRNVAVFTNYDITFNEITQLSAGLRYEHVIYNFYDSGIKNSVESNTYNNIFPSLSFNTTLMGVRYSLNYRIQTIRPMYEMLKSAINYGNRLTYLSGNPGLQPTYVNSVELDASYHDINMQVGYNHYKDDIIFDVEQMQGNEKIGINKFNNIKSRNVLTFMSSYSPMIGFWQPSLTVAGTYQFLSTPFLGEKKNMNGALVQFQLNNSFKLPSDFILRMDGQWTTNGNMQNQYVHSSGSLNTSIYKEWHNGLWSIMLEGTDLLHTLREASTFYFNKTLLYRESKNNSHGISLTLRYKLNNKQREYKGTGAGNEERQRL